MAVQAIYPNQKVHTLNPDFSLSIRFHDVARTVRCHTTIRVPCPIQYFLASRRSNKHVRLNIVVASTRGSRLSTARCHGPFRHEALLNLVMHRRVTGATQPFMKL